MTRATEAFWSAQRPVVDRVRQVVARHQTGHAAGPGPLLSQAGLRPLDFVATRPLRQPDRTSCGSATLTMLRMLRDPAYAAVVLDGPDPVRAFGTAALDVRRRTNAGRDARGRVQLPWPASLGTRPAAMTRLLTGATGYGAPGRRYRNIVIDPFDPRPVLEAIAGSVSAGEPVPLYVGDGHWMQHIVLVVRAASDRLSVYDPAAGHEVPITRAEFLDDRIRVAGWTRPWLAILV